MEPQQILRKLLGENKNSPKFWVGTFFDGASDSDFEPHSPRNYNDNQRLFIFVWNINCWFTRINVIEYSQMGWFDRKKYFENQMWMNDLSFNTSWHLTFQPTSIKLTRKNLMEKNLKDEKTELNFADTCLESNFLYR